jgi:polyisoprenyl-teichoic acid--peptidoglycan teichoic acid transferase
MSFPIESSRNQSNLPRILLIILLILVATTGLSLLINNYIIRPYLTLRQPMTVLLVGEDKSSNRFPSVDTLILVFIDPGNTKVSLLSIPPDSQTDVPQPDKRIKEASAKGGIRYTEQLVSELTKTKIDHYMAVNFYGFQQLVDILDGVEVNVTETIRYTDRFGQPVFEINPGRQVLNGEQALQYVRYLDPKGDIDRIARQHAVLDAIIKKAGHSMNFFSMFKMYRAIKKCVKTDLSFTEKLQLAAFAKSMDLRRDVTTYILPGTPAEIYWKPDDNEIGRLIMKLR